jgi:hypothetical protein
MLPLLWALDKSLSTLKASQTDGLRNPASPQGARSIVNGNGIKTPPASAANAQTSAPPKSPRRSRPLPPWLIQWRRRLAVKALALCLRLATPALCHGMRERSRRSSAN